MCLNRKFQCDGIVCERYKSSDIENAMHRKVLQYIASYVKDMNLGNAMQRKRIQLHYMAL